MSTFKIQSPVPEFNSRFDKDPNHKEKFDQLFDEEMMIQKIEPTQIEEMYQRHVNYLMKRLETCTYAEFNGNTVYGLDRTKFAFEVDLKLLNMTSEYEGYDVIKARSKSGDTYLFHVDPATHESALSRLLWKGKKHV